MSADRDLTRIVRSWLRTDEHESPDRLLDNVLAALDTTPQRRSWWPARRSTQMNNYAKLALAAAAIVVLAVVGYNLLPRQGSVGAVPTPSPTAKSSPTAEPPFPPTGKLAPGRHSMILAGVPFTFNLTTDNWVSNGSFGIDKATPDTGGFIFWADSAADGVFSDPCHDGKAPEAGPEAIDMANAITTIPNTRVVSAPTAITIGGRPAQTVAIKVDDVLPCRANPDFYLWYDSSNPDNARYASQEGVTIRVWLIDVDGKRVQIDGETFKGAGAGPGAELLAIVESIQFE